MRTRAFAALLGVLWIAGPFTLAGCGESPGEKPAEDASGMGDAGAFCGDLLVSGDEDCDGSNLGGQDCLSLGLGFTGGELRCRMNCTLQIANCTICGNGVVQGDEVCDGSGHDPVGCSSVIPGGFCGETQCAADCSGWDQSDCQDATGLGAWARRFGGPGHDIASGLALDALGGPVVTGAFRGAVDFDDGSGPQASAGESDVFVLRMDSSGNSVWSRRLGGAGADSGAAVAMNATGNITVVGSFSDTVTFDASAYTSRGLTDAFIVQLDAAGQPRWADTLGGVGSDHASRVVADATGNVYVIGTFDATFGCVWCEWTQWADAGLFLAKYTADGSPLWLRQYDGPGAYFGMGLALVDNGQVIMTGTFDQSIDFGGGPLISAGNGDIFLVKLDQNGRHVWSRSFGDGAGDIGVDVAAQPGGDLLVVGAYNGTVDFGGGELPTAAPMWDLFAFVTRLDGSGNHVWSRGFHAAEGVSGGLVMRVAVDAAERVTLCGALMGNIDFGGGVLSPTGGMDILLAQLDPAGNHIMSTHLGSDATPYEAGFDIAIGPTGRIVMVGAFGGTTAFGAASLTAAGDTDAFVVGYDPAACQ